MLGDKPHQAVAELSKTYGPIMSLKLGSNTTIVISSPEVAKEMFLNHDMTVSSRTVPHAGRASNHDKFSMVWLPVCPKWRDLRKVATIQLFTNQRLDTSQDVRHKKVKELVEYVQQCSQKGLPVDIGKAAFTTVLNLLSNTFFSMDMASHTSSKSQEFKDLVWNLLEIGARPNLSDFFPLVKNLDLQGVLKITRVYMNKLMKIFDDIIDERLKDQTEVKYDVLDTLLKLVENNELSLDDVKHLLVLPPGPKPWPIIGNIHQLGDKPHRAVAELSKKYGPIMSLKLGSNTTIVISSPEVAKEMFTKHDLQLSSRAIPDAGRAGNHDKFSMVWLPVCPKWRDLRKIATIQLFTNQRLDTSQDVRHKKVKELVEYVEQCSEKGLAVDVGKAGFTTVLNLLSNTFFSMDMASYTSKSQEFKDLVGNLLELGAKPNLSDFFPLVKHLDLQGMLKITSGYWNKFMSIFEEIIDERLKDQTEVKDDVLGTLLKLVEINELSIDDVKHLLAVSYTNNLFSI
ncbi:hypothetical protein SOVF_079970 [Spinacia oleracea]|nr:hypothetical protein SOVF_079970 [Spinacia oleracea]